MPLNSIHGRALTSSVTNIFHHQAINALSLVATFLPPIATFFVVWATKTEGKRNHQANRQMIESNRHLINLQYRASVYRDVIQFMAVNRHRVMRKYLNSQEPQSVEQTNVERSPEVNRDELSVFVALELHASDNALKAYFRWDDKLTTCTELIHQLIERHRNDSARNRPENTSWVDSNAVLHQVSELDRLEKAFLETVKQEVAL